MITGETRKSCRNCWGLRYERYATVLEGEGAIMLGDLCAC